MNPANAANPPARNARVQTRSNHVSFTANLRDFVFNNFPVFNLWDAVALAYSLCAEPLYFNRGAELHLYQIYIFQQTISLYTGRAVHSPITLAGTWSKPTSSKPIIVAWAFTCTGKDKRNAVPARRAYCTALHSLVELSASDLHKGTNYTHYPGNCPEYSTWAQVCTQSGEYFSLCLNTIKHTSLKFCFACDEVAKASKAKKGIVVHDLWDNSSLVLVNSPTTTSTLGYDGKPLKDVRDLLKEGAPKPL